MAGAVVLCAALWLRLGPIDPTLLDDSGSTSTVVVDRTGVPLYEALSGDGTRAIALAADALPPALVAATVAAEDRRFWRHPGIDLLAVARALKRNLAERAIVEGGSTITQQVAKLLLNRRTPDRSRGVRAKAAEAILALRLEHRFSKREILAMYLNLAAYGNQVSGAERASRAYFDRTASMLTPAQAAFIAALPQRPSRFNPYRSPESARARQQAVLRRMEAAGFIDPAAARLAREERLALVRTSAQFLAPHFVEMVLAEGRGHTPPLQDIVRAEPVPAQVRRGGACPRPSECSPSRIETTLDAALQSDVAGIIRSHRPLLERHGAANVAVVVLDNQRAEWLAWEGSGDYFDAERGGTINGPMMPRQPGSALKPLTYALAFEHGYSPASVLPDIPSHFPTAEPGVVYSPRNYDGRYRGPLRARAALAGSENVPAVALASELGVPSLLRFFSRAGLSTFDRTASFYGLGVTLGNAEVRLDELAAAYATFARGGDWIAPSYVRRESAERVPLVSATTAFWITNVLSDADAREYAFGRGGSLDFPFPVAAKTGTSQAYHDNWTIGYTRDVTVGVWVGNFDRTPLRNSSGVTGAAPIFHAVMMAAVRRMGGATTVGRGVGSVGRGFSPGEYGGDAGVIVPAPTSLVRQDICGLSGMAANAWCPTRQREWLARDEVLLPCSWHHLADEGLQVVWPAEYRQWALASASVATSAAMPALRSTAAPAGAARNTGSTAKPTIVNPPAGATYLIDPTLRREFQTLPLRVVTAASGSVEWRVNDRTVGTVSSEKPLHWPLVPGRHTISARLAGGEAAETTIVVR